MKRRRKRLKDIKGREALVKFIIEEGAKAYFRLIMEEALRELEQET